VKLDVFIQGELIDLCIPTEDFAAGSEWYNWFNNPKTTRFLEQGIFPNTSKDQVQFFQNQKGGKSRLILIISDKEDYIGTISLSFINHEKKTASIAMLIGEESKKAHFKNLFALESMARIVEHGITKLGLIRIDAGQHHKLFNWQQRLELLGFRAEAIKRNGFIKGIEKADSVGIALVVEDYLAIKERRGNFWDSAINMNERIKQLPKEAFIEKLRHVHNVEGNAYYNKIFSL